MYFPYFGSHFVIIEVFEKKLFVIYYIDNCLYFNAFSADIIGPYDEIMK